MPTTIDQRRYYLPEELQPGRFDGIIDEHVDRQRQILDFTGLEEHDEQIEMDVWVQQADRRASITGFADRAPRVQGRKADNVIVDPFHIKNSRSFDVDDAGLRTTADGRPVIAEGSVDEATTYLENLRRNLQVGALLTALNDGVFSYENDDIHISVPYDQYIKDDQTGPVTDWDQASPSPLKDLRLLKRRYARDVGQTPNLCFISGATGAEILDLDSIGQKYEPQQPSDPDRTAETFDRFAIEGILFVVLHREFWDGNSLREPIPEGEGLFTVAEVQEDGGAPMRVHRLGTELNDEDPRSPKYGSKTVETEPTPEASIYLYDNMIPGFPKRDIVRRFQFYTP